MRMICRILAVVLTVSLVCVGCGGKPPRQHYEKAGAFSYDPPSGWQVIEFQGLKYRICHGPRENEFAPNISVIDEAFSGALAAYVDANLLNMANVQNTEEAFVNMKVLSREDFKTQDNESAVKILSLPPVGWTGLAPS